MGDASAGGRTGDGAAGTSCARVRTDARGTVRAVEPSFTALLGWAPDELVGHRLGELAHPDDLDRGLRTWARLAEVPAGTGCSVRIRYRHRDGHWVWADVTSRRVPGPDDDVVTDLVDVGAELALAERLAARDQLLAHLSDVARAGLFHAEGDGALRYASRRLEELTGVEGASTLATQLAGVAEEDRVRFRAALQQAAGGSETVVELAAGPQGGRRWRVNLRPLRDQAGAVTGVSGCLEDATERPGPGVPDTDPLTGCLTLNATLAALDALLARHGPADPGRAGGPTDRRQGDGRGTAVVVVDLAHLVALGTLVEEHGQPALDELLRLVALRIVDTVRSSDAVGRTGDVEFTALCAGVPGPTTARSIGRSILKQVGSPIVLQAGGSLSIHPGLGVAWASRSGVRAFDLLRRAQDAAIASKLSDPAEPVLAEGATPVSPPAPPR